MSKSSTANPDSAKADTANPAGPTRTFDGVELEILWQSLISTVNEQARSLQRSAFSPIVREAGDLANAKVSLAQPRQRLSLIHI